MEVGEENLIERFQRLFKEREKGVLLVGAENQYFPPKEYMHEKLKLTLRKEFERGCRFFKVIPCSLFTVYAIHYCDEIGKEYPNETYEYTYVHGNNYEELFEHCDTVLCYMNKKKLDADMSSLLSAAEYVGMNIINLYKNKNSTVKPTV